MTGPGVPNGGASSRASATGAGESAATLPSAIEPDAERFERARAMRRAFDESFARPAVGAAREPLRFLVALVAGRTVAMRISDLEGVHPNVQLLRPPGGPPAFAGIAAARGRPLAVHDLGVLLDLRAQPEARFIAVVRGAPSVALLFEAQTRYIEVEPTALSDGTGGTFLRDGGELLPIVDVPGLVARLIAQTQEAR